MSKPALISNGGLKSRQPGPVSQIGPEIFLMLLVLALNPGAQSPLFKLSGFYMGDNFCAKIRKLDQNVKKHFTIVGKVERSQILKLEF
jgi:hypothetical protein